MILIPSEGPSHGIAGSVHWLWKNLSGVLRQWSQLDRSFFPRHKLSRLEPRLQKDILQFRLYDKQGCNPGFVYLSLFCPIFVHFLLLQSYVPLIIWWESVLKHKTPSHKTCWSKLRCWLTRDPGFPSKPDAPCVIWLVAGLVGVTRMTRTEISMRYWWTNVTLQTT